MPETFEEVQGEERRQLVEGIAAWSAKFPNVQVREAVVSGDEATAVLDASIGAELLVVGAHQRKIPGSLALGRITHAAIHHAHCPVAVRTGLAAPEPVL